MEYKDIYLPREIFYKQISDTLVEKHGNKYRDISEEVCECVFKKMYPEVSPYRWNNNSCYIDAILMFMLYSKYNFWRKKLRKAILSEDPFQKTISRLLLSSDSCFEIRKILHKKDPRITLKEMGEAVTFYEIIADIFSMKFKSRVEYIEYRPQKEEESVLPDMLAVSPLLKIAGKTLYQDLSFLSTNYKRIGIILHRGAHYTCYFISHGGWVYYDDLIGKFIYKTPTSVVRGELEFYIRKDKIDRYL